MSQRSERAACAGMVALGPGDAVQRPGACATATKAKPGIQFGSRAHGEVGQCHKVP